MGLFRKAPKQKPIVVTQGIELEFDPNGAYWAFSYRGVRFASFDHRLELPSVATLNEFIDTVDALKPEMLSRLSKGLEGWGDAKINEGESFSVDFTSLPSQGTIMVSWSDGEHWGDLGADFTIKDGKIIEEAWGD